MFRWAEKVAIVTGSSSGIGLKTAKTLVEKGMSVVGLDIKDCEDSTFKTLKCDVAKQDEVAEAFKWTKDNVGNVQVLINNAAIYALGRFTDVDASTLQRIMDVNIMGCVYCAREALKMIEAEDLEGHIINMNSISGHRAVKPLNSDINIYSASKYAMTGFSETLGLEVLGKNIRVTNLSPGFVRTNLLTNYGTLQTLKEPALESSDIADAIVYVLNLPQRVEVKEWIIRPLGETIS